MRLIVLLIAFLLANFTNKYLGEASQSLNLFRFICLMAGYILAQVGVFFLTAFLLSLPIKTSEEEEYSPFYRFVMKCYIKICLSLFGVKVNATGIEKLPKNEKFVIVSNHLSNFDPLILDIYLKDFPLVFVAKDSLFKIPFFGKMIKKVGYLSLNRSDVRQEVKTIKKGVSLLTNEITSVCVYPEGTRNFTDERLLEFKPGCFNLVTKSKKPLVISYIAHTNDIKNGLLYKKHPVTLKIVKVIEYEEIKDMNTFEISDMVRNIMLENIESELKNGDLNDININMEEI